MNNGFKKRWQHRLWNISCVGMVVLSVLCFSPLIIPAGVFTPTLAGMPFSLWGGGAISLGMILCICIAAYSGSDDDEELR